MIASRRDAITLCLGLLLFVVSPIVAQGQWEKEQPLVYEGVCPASGLDPCWAYLSTKFFDKCCAPYPAPVSSGSDKWLLSLSASDFAKYKTGTVLKTGTISDEITRKGIADQFTAKGAEVTVPWFLGLIDKIGFTTLTDLINDLNAKTRLKATELAATTAMGGRFSYVIQTGTDRDGHKWARKAVLYTVQVGAETRSYHVGGVRVAVAVP